jgi:hypothetical protein
VAAAAAGIGVAVMVLTTAVGIEVPPRRNEVFEYLIPELSAGRVARVAGASNWGLLVGLGPRASVLAILLWVVMGGAGLAWLRARAEPFETDRDPSERARS